MQKVAERLNVLKISTDERNEYYKYCNDVLQERDVHDAALIKGRQEGRQEDERDKSFSIAQSMISKGLISRLLWILPV